ncbi:MAG TPA: D-alanine--D-alanine ligase [Phycisphaerales bacterium]|nr:D-alanine--D-alanine ligase [Phycisphaerales bacterium]
MSIPNVVVLMGGPDAEHDVSIRSGTAVAQALSQSGEFNVQTISIQHTSEKDLIEMQADVFFPVLHGPYGEGGPLQKLLENTGIPFVGSGSKESETAMNKIKTKEIAKQIGIQTPNWGLLTEHIPCSVSLPLILKPIDDGSSIDMAICHDDKELEQARLELHKSRTSLLAESYICGREITIGIINGNPLPVIEIIPPKDCHTYDFAAKYERDDTQYIVDPVLPENPCVKNALELYSKMNINDIARVDFILNDQGPWLLEINTMPGFTDHSLIPMAAKHAGFSMPMLCSALVANALLRASLLNP